MTIDSEDLKTALNQRAETWRQQVTNPQDINTAIYISLLEVVEAIRDVEARSVL